MNPPRLRLFLLALVALLALSACTSKPRAAAVVNGQTITDEQLKASIPLFEFFSQLNNTTCGQTAPAAQGAPAPAGPDVQKACARLALSTLIQEDLVKEYAAEHRVTVPDAELNTTIGNITRGVGGEATLSKQLADGNLTISDLRDFLRRLLLFGNVQTELGRSEFTDEQLRGLYQQNRDQFTILHTKHILVKDEGQAEKILQQATPENFEDLAAKFSTDPSVEQNGGDLGETPAAGLVPEFVDAVLKASPGDIIGPVKTQFGWHVIYVVDVKTTSFEEAKDQLINNQSQQIFQEWLMGRLKDSEIEINPRYGRLDQATGQIVPITSTAATPSAIPPASPAGQGVSPPP